MRLGFPKCIWTTRAGSSVTVRYILISLADREPEPEPEPEPDHAWFTSAHGDLQFSNPKLKTERQLDGSVVSTCFCPRCGNDGQVTNQPTLASLDNPSSHAIEHLSGI